MKNKIFLIACIFIAMFATTLAQGKNGKGKERSAEARATAQTKHLTKQLGLNQDQQTKIQAVNLTANQKADAAKASKDRAARIAANKERRDGIQNILTAEQKTKYQQILDNKKNKAKDKIKGKAKGKNKKDDEDDDDDE